MSGDEMGMSNERKTENVRRFAIGSVDGRLATAHQGGADSLARPCGDCHAISHATAPGSTDTFKIRAGQPAR